MASSEKKKKKVVKERKCRTIEKNLEKNYEKTRRQGRERKTSEWEIKDKRVKKATEGGNLNM